jgi:hypothetical protein
LASAVGNRGRPLEYRTAGSSSESISARIAAWSGSRVFQRLLPERLSLEKCVEATVFSDPGFESVAERKHIL